MQETPATISGLAIGTMPGHILCVTVVFDEPGIRELSREDVTSAWLARLVDVLSVGAVALGSRVMWSCRVRHDDRGNVTAIGSASGFRWMDIDDAPAPLMAPTPAEKALRYLNNYYARFGRQPLDPAASGYSDDDVIADARLHGWPG